MGKKIPAAFSDETFFTVVAVIFYRRGHLFDLVILFTKFSCKKPKRTRFFLPAPISRCKKRKNKDCLSPPSTRGNCRDCREAERPNARACARRAHVCDNYTHFLACWRTDSKSRTRRSSCPTRPDWNANWSWRSPPLPSRFASWAASMRSPEGRKSWSCAGRLSGRRMLNAER